jgi:hypothetical protein
MNKLMHITAEAGTWGKAQQLDVSAVLKSAVIQLWQHCPNTSLNPIIVRYRLGNPLAGFARDEWARIQVWLSATDTFWSQYAYQMAHEFGHILAIHSNENANHWHELKHANHWLEECFCETASLFALMSMANEWQSAAPYPTWTSYASALASYAQNVIYEGHVHLPPNESLPEWLKANEPILRTNSLAGNTDANRPANKIVAARLLPAFQTNPAGWEALTFLNLVSRDTNKTLREQLIEWRSLCGPNLQSFVSCVGTVLGINI